MDTRPTLPPMPTRIAAFRPSDRDKTRQMLNRTIRDMRSHLGLSQEALAKRLGVSWRTVTRYEGDLPPTGAALLRLIRYAQEVGPGADRFASQFRRAYVQELGEVGLARIAEAYGHLCLIEKSLAVLVGHLGGDEHPAISDAVKQIETCSVNIVLTLGQVLPWPQPGHEIKVTEQARRKLEGVDA